MANNLLESALNYAELGLAVFPLIPKDKKPLTKNGFKDATTDKSQIKTWWTENPDANIGVATGQISGGLVVIDCDVDKDKGKDGYHTFLDWVDDHYLYLEDTWQSITGRGGYHIMFKVDHPVKSRIAWLDAVDVKADGGYIVAPPSIHPNGNRYEWEYSPEDCDILTNDNGDVECIMGFINAENKDAENTSFQCPEAIKEGERNGVLFKLACSLQSKGMSDKAIHEAVMTENKEKCSPPLPDREVETIVKQALAYPKGEGITPEAPAKATGKITLKRVCDIQQSEVSWLIPSRIPKGEVCLFAGEGGTGKTTTVCDLIAGITTGRKSFLESDITIPVDEWETHEAGEVLYFSSEDDFSKVLVGRLKQHGADLTKIQTVETTDEGFNDITFDSEMLEQIIAEYKPTLCVFDPIQSFIPVGVNMSARNEMRKCMNPLVQLGHKYGTTFVILMHTNKKRGAWGRYRLADSSDLWDIARSIFMFGYADRNGTRYVSHEKCSYGKNATTLLFGVEAGKVKFKGTSDKTDYDFVSETDRQSRSAPQLDATKEFIIDRLKEAEGHCMKVSELEDIARACGYAGHTIKDAKASLTKEGKAVINNSGFGKDKAYWIRLYEKVQ